jgi:hypothetical protein
MATVINEVTIEPKAAPPEAAGAAKSADAGGMVPPEVQHEIAKMIRRSRERAARLFAH